MKALPALVLALLAGAANSQAPDPAKQFEVASIKPAPASDGRGMRVGARGGPGTSDPTRIVIENYNVFALVSQAYNLKIFQISGVEAFDQQRFNINLKVPEGATKEDVRMMYQNLLAERFHMKVHRETKELPIYELIIGKGGVKFKESPEKPKSDDQPAPARISGPPKLDGEGYPIIPPGMMMITMVNGSPRARVNAVEETMEMVAAKLSNQLGRMVVDATGLKGKYDYILSWSPDGGGPRPVVPGSGDGASAPEPSGPSLEAAVQQQLGLKLESKKAPVEILIVDHYEKTPTEN